MLLQLTASWRLTPKWQQEKGLSKAMLSSPDCGHPLQREGEAMAVCWVPVHHCCVFCPERETHLLVGFKWVSLINLSLAQIRQPTILFSVYVFSETSGFMFCLVSTFCSVQVKAAIQKLSGTWQCSSSWSYSFNIFVEVKGNWDRLLPILKKSAISCGFCSATCSCG